MNAILEEFGKKLAGRWASSVLFPGILLVAALVVALTLGQSSALRWMDGYAAAIQFSGSLTGSQLIAVFALALLLAYTSGLMALALGSMIIRVAVAARPRWLVGRRLRRAERRNPAQPASYLPARLTPVGDTWKNAGKRVEIQYGLDLTLVWPRLWLLISEDSRKIISESLRSHLDAALLIGWAVLFLLCGSLWWPAAIGGVLAFGVGCGRFSRSASAVTQLVESAVDMNQLAIAAALGVELPQGRMTPNEGALINNVLRKRQVLD